MRQTKSEDIGDILMRLAMGEREVIQARAREMGYAFVDLDRIQIAQDALNQLLPAEAHRHGVLPVKVQDNTLYLAMSNPSDLRAIDAATLSTGKRIVPVLAIKEGIERALQRYYPNGKTEGS